MSYYPYWYGPVELDTVHFRQVTFQDTQFDQTHLRIG